jgi:hypothetical protein
VLQHLDDDLAVEAQSGRCPFCGGVLHRAAYPRKPRGGPAVLPDGFARRHSFCCDAEGCRRRVTPPSVRFLGRRVFVGTVVVIAATLRHGLTRARVRRLRDDLGVSRRTLERWRAWWREAFAASPWWRGVRGRFMPPVPTATLPRSLLERFAGDGHVPLVKLLELLAPITTGAGVTMAS